MITGMRNDWPKDFLIGFRALNFGFRDSAFSNVTEKRYGPLKKKKIDSPYLQVIFGALRSGRRKYLGFE